MKNLLTIFATGSAVLLGLSIASPVSASHGQNIYASSESDQLYSVNVLPRGTDTFIGNTPTLLDISELTPHPTGTLYGIDDDGSLFTFDRTLGIFTLIGDTGLFINGLAFNRDGDLFGIGGSNLYSIDPEDATTVLVGSIEPFSSLGDIEFAPDGTLYGAVDGGGVNSVLVTIDVSTGAATQVLPLPKFGETDLGSPVVFGLAFVGGKLYGLTNSYDGCEDNGAVIRIEMHAANRAGSAQFVRCLTFGAFGGT